MLQCMSLQIQYLTIVCSVLSYAQCACNHQFRTWIEFTRLNVPYDDGRHLQGDEMPQLGSCQEQTCLHLFRTDNLCVLRQKIPDFQSEKS
jgi:hypothetical protein